MTNQSYIANNTSNLLPPSHSKVMSAHAKKMYEQMNTTNNTETE